MVTPIAFRELDRTPTVLHDDDVSMVQRGWDKFDHSPDRNLSIAAERLALLGEAAKSEENLVDILIAIEALVGKDLNEELPYRISLRVARFISKDLELGERDVFAHIRQAFRVRNKLLRSLRIQNADYLGLQPQEFVKQAESIARKMLQKMLSLDRRELPDWEDIHLRAPTWK